MDKPLFINEHFEKVNDAIFEIREQIAFTENIPAKRLVELFKQHTDLQNTAQFIAFLGEQYTDKKKDKGTGLNGSKIITMQ